MASAAGRMIVAGPAPDSAFGAAPTEAGSAAVTPRQAVGHRPNGLNAMNSGTTVPIPLCGGRSRIRGFGRRRSVCDSLALPEISRSTALRLASARGSDRRERRVRGVGCDPASSWTQSLEKGGSRVPRHPAIKSRITPAAPTGIGKCAVFSRSGNDPVVAEGMDMVERSTARRRVRNANGPR